MGRKKKSQTVLGILITVILLIGMIPGIAMGAPITLSWFDFVSNADSTVIVGETNDINLLLYDGSNDPFTGAVTAYIEDSEGNLKKYSINGSQGNYTITKVTLDNPGVYNVIIYASSPNLGSASRHILQAVNAVASVTGSLIINTNNTLSVKVADTTGKLLVRKSVTVDGTAVGANAQAFTTLYDGTFTFSMNPSSYGTVKITYSGHVIGSITVIPAYTQYPRIGNATVDNVSLSVEVAKNGWAQGTRTVILVRDDQFSDAMAAVPLSKKFNAPILMTDSSTLDERTLTEMRRLGVSNVYIIGGTVAISQDIQDRLSEFMITRFAGQQGYDTAALISSYVGIDATNTVYLANGHAIPDALAASAFAAEQGNPILLTDRDQLPPSTIQALANLNVSNVVLLGGTAVIGTQVEDELRAKYSVKRWGGYDRYDTQTIIFQNLVNTQTPQSPLYFTSGLVRQDDVISGKPYADALLTAALAAKNGGFVAMLPPNSLPSSLNYFLLFNKGYISKSAVVGNHSRVYNDIEQQLQQILNH